MVSGYLVIGQIMNLVFGVHSKLFVSTGVVFHLYGLSAYPPPKLLLIFLSYFYGDTLKSIWSHGVVRPAFSRPSRFVFAKWRIRPGCGSVRMLQKSRSMKVFLDWCTTLRRWGPGGQERSLIAHHLSWIRRLYFCRTSYSEHLCKFHIQIDSLSNRLCRSWPSELWRQYHLGPN